MGAKLQLKSGNSTNAMITLWLHFSEIIVSPGNGQQDVATKQHAREQGQQQDGDIKAIAPLAEDDTIAIGLQPLTENVLPQKSRIVVAIL